MISYADLCELVHLSGERFKYDQRYHLNSLSDGFACRIGSDDDDSALLDRICAAYIKAEEHQRSASTTFGATKWWQQISQRHLTPVVQALRTRNISRLRQMYRNFFRDRCSTGLVGLPVDMEQCYFRGEVKPLYGYYFLADALHRLDLWKARTHGKFPLRVLASPVIGNPYGVSIDGVFIRIGAESQHFYAQEIDRLVRSRKVGTVLEVGGGFGGMAYYLIRDNPRLTYVNFDVPETIALASYYLLRAFPTLTATLYGEAELTSDVLNNSRIILMPSWQLAALPDASGDVSFSSHVLADLSPESAYEYTDQLARTTRSHILLVDHAGTRAPLTVCLLEKSGRFRLVRKRATFWECAKALRTNEAEWLYTATKTLNRTTRSNSGS